MPAFAYLYFRLLKNAVMMSFAIIFQNQHLRMLLMAAAPGDWRIVSDAHYSVYHSAGSGIFCISDYKIQINFIAIESCQPE